VTSPALFATDASIVMGNSLHWRPTRDGDPIALELYLRHYSARQYLDGRPRRLFVGPGEKLVLVSHDDAAMLAWRICSAKPSAGSSNTRTAKPTAEPDRQPGPRGRMMTNGTPTTREAPMPNPPTTPRRTPLQVAEDELGAIAEWTDDTNENRSTP